MLHHEFVDRVLRSEEHCVAFLRTHGILDEAVMYCSRKLVGGAECGAEMNRTTRKNREGEKIPTWRCTSCYTFRSMRQTNEFFSWDGFCHLSMRQIMTIVYFWLHTTVTIEQAHSITGHNSETLVNWFFCCRQVCSDAMERAPKLVGTEEAAIKVDESYFQGRRKNRRGRKLRWDKASDRADGKNVLVENTLRHDDLPLSMWIHSEDYTTDIIMNNWRVDVPTADEDESNPLPSRNYGNRELGPWVVGLYQSKTNVRFKVVPDRRAATLIPLIDSLIQEGSVIMSDEWKGYNPLRENGFVHYTVNHKRHFVDPHTLVHTQEIERQWVDAKAFMKRARGPTTMLQSHLDEVAWRKLRSVHPDGLMAAFLRDVYVMYDTNLP